MAPEKEPHPLLILAGVFAAIPAFLAALTVLAWIVAAVTH